MKKIKEETQVKILFVIMICVLAAVLIPLFVIAHYNFRSVDDYPYCVGAETVWRETGSVLKVMWAQVLYTWDYYNEWQGTYFFEWFSTTLMGFFSKNAYYICTYLCLGGLVLCEMWAFMTIFRKCLGADKYRAAIVSISCICMQVLLTPVPVEAYYWFCGCVLYTFFHALGWVLVALLVHTYFDENRSKAKRVLLEIGILFISFAIGGSNYVTGLTVLLVYFFYVLWMFYRKHKSKFVALGNALFYLVAFGLNILAPGNTKRLELSGEESISAVEAVVLSIKEAVNYVFVNMIPPCVILGIMLIPLFVCIVKKKNYRYPLPLLVSLITFGLFAAQYAPTMYTLQIAGAGRILNLYRFNFYVLLFGNELYWIGWICRRVREKYGTVPGRDVAIVGEVEAGNGETDSDKTPGSWLLPGWAIGGMLLCLSLYFWGGSTITTISAIKSLASGEAKQYYAEHQERLKLLEDDRLTEVYVEPFSVKPYLLYFGDMTENTLDELNNTPVAEYFGKEKVGLKKQDASGQ